MKNGLLRICSKRYSPFVLLVAAVGSVLLVLRNPPSLNTMRNATTLPPSSSTSFQTTAYAESNASAVHEKVAIVSNHVADDEPLPITPQELPSKPLFVIHIGPHKTGSTYFQCALSEPQAYETLLQDNYVFLGTSPGTCSPKVPGLVAHTYENATSILLGGRERVHNPQWAPGFGLLLNQTLAKQQNAIVVFELFDSFHADLIRGIRDLLVPDWRVKIVANYRRVYEWLPSLYNQRYKPREKDERTSLWPGQRGKQSTGQAVPPFNLNPGGFVAKRIEQLERTGMHPTKHALRKYYPFFDDIFIIDQHHPQTSIASGQKPTPVAEFLCRGLEGARHSCAAATANPVTIGGGGGNPSVSLNYDILAVAAYNKGLVTKKAKRRDVRNAIQAYQEGSRNLTANDFPSRCPSKSMEDHLFELSAKAEANLFGKEGWKKLEDDHRQAFDEFVAKKKLCSVDTDQVLNDPDWKDFFAKF